MCSLEIKIIFVRFVLSYVYFCIKVNWFQLLIYNSYSLIPLVLKCKSQPPLGKSNYSCIKYLLTNDYKTSGECRGKYKQRLLVNYSKIFDFMF